MYKFRNRRFKEQNEEKEKIQDKPKLTQKETRKENNQENSDKLELCSNLRISFKRGNKNGKYKDEIPSQKNEENKYYNSKTARLYKSNISPFKENKEINDFPDTNQKLRNTLTGLNNDKMKYKSGLIDIILKVEKDNVNHYLKGDLAEMYHDINRNNYYFKNDVFLANVDNFDRKTGIFDKKPVIPYNCSEDISVKLDRYPRTNEIIEKFTEKTKTFSYV